MASNEDWLEELANRTGASVESSDLDRMREFEEGIAAGTTSQDQYDRYRDALSNQYELRGGTQQTGDGPDSTELTRAGYGSEMDEKLYEWDGRNDVNIGDSPLSSWANTSGGSSSGWSQAPTAESMFPDWYRDLMERQLSMQEQERAENEARADALFGTLSDRMNQTLAIDRTDPIIRAQADAFAANQERARRNYLSDVAEASGPYANLQGERRMAAERYGATTGAYEANLMGQELAARRQEIAQALSMAAGMLSGDQVRQLQSELASIDAALRESGMGMNYSLGLRGQDFGMDQFLRDLALREWDRNQYWNYANIYG